MVSPSHPIINLLHVLDKIYPKTKPRIKRMNQKEQLFRENPRVKTALITH